MLVGAPALGNCSVVSSKAKLTHSLIQKKKKYMYGLAYRPIWNFNSSTFWNNSKLETAQIPMNSMNML